MLFVFLLLLLFYYYCYCYYCFTVIIIIVVVFIIIILALTIVVRSPCTADRRLKSSFLAWMQWSVLQLLRITMALVVIMVDNDDTCGDYGGVSCI